MNETGIARILHIEDDPSDAELVAILLQRAAFPCDIHLVRSLEECLTALESGRFDLVLSDSHGHDFTGVNLLHLVRERMPDVPFIFLSGSFDDADPETLKAEGATNCILKGDMETLIPVLRRALQDQK